MIPFTENITRKQRGYTRNADTRRAEVTVTGTSTISGHVKPASGKDLEILPEGERTGHELVVLTKTAVQVSDDQASPKQPSDLLEIDGYDYKPINVEHYRAVLPHFKVLCVRV